MQIICNKIPRYSPVLTHCVSKSLKSQDISSLNVPHTTFQHLPTQLGSVCPLLSLYQDSHHSPSCASHHSPDVHQLFSVGHPCHSLSGWCPSIAESTQHSPWFINFFQFSTVKMSMRKATSLPPYLQLSGLEASRQLPLLIALYYTNKS